jgi:DNA-binding MarR family transcriptional regulator
VDIAAKPDGDTLAEALSRRLSRLARELARQVDGPSRTQHSVLARLADEGPRRVTELALAERVAQPSMTALVSRLADAGLVDRCVDESDRRAVVVALTPAGAAELARVRAARLRLVADRLGRLDDDERRRLADALPVLDKLVDGPVAS